MDHFIFAWEPGYFSIFWEGGYSRVSNRGAGTTSGFSAMGRPAWKKNRVPAAKIRNPALQLGKEKSAGRVPVRPGFSLISSPIDLRFGK